MIGVNPRGAITTRVEINSRCKDPKDTSRCNNPEAIDQLEVQRPQWNEWGITEMG